MVMEEWVSPEYARILFETTNLRTQILLLFNILLQEKKISA